MELWYNNSNGDASINSMAKSAKSKSDAKDDSVLGKYMRMFNNSWTYAQQNYHQTWEDNWKLYRNIRVKKNHPGTIEAFVPMVNSTVNTIVASLFNSNPSVKYIPNRVDQEDETEILNDVYQDFARRDGWALKNKINGRQGVITGNYFEYLEWQPDDNGGYVHKEVVPIRDAIIDPNAHNLDDAEYVGRRFFTSKKNLEEATIYNPETKKVEKRYKDLTDVQDGGGMGGVDTESDKAKKDEALGSVSPDRQSQVEIIEIWTHKEVVVIANRKMVIEQRENPYYTLAKAKFEQRKLEHELLRAQTLQETAGLEDIGPFDEEFNAHNAGLIPFAHGCEYPDVSLVYGSSDVDIIADEQELLNTITELNVEAVLYQLYPERRIDPKFADKIDNLDPAPGKIYPLPMGAMDWQTPPAVPTNAFAERNNLKGEIREAASVSEISKGITATDSTTATEIKAMLGQADIRIREKADNLAQGFFRQEAIIVFKLLQLYADENYMLRTVGEDGVNFERVDMTKFKGEYTPMVTLDVQARLERSEKQEAYMSAFQMIIADPTNNLQAAKEIMYPKMMPDLSAEEIDRIITPEQPPMAPEMAEPAPQEMINPEMQDLGAQDMMAQDQLTEQEEQPIYG
jgi:hypothetical protein